MRHRGFDPTRRNRKIGTEEAGWKKPTPFLVPERWGEFRYEMLKDPVLVHRTVHRRDLSILVEPTRDGFVHACTPDDIAYLLNLMPAESLFHHRRAAPASPGQRHWAASPRRACGPTDSIRGGSVPMIPLRTRRGRRSGR